MSGPSAEAVPSLAGDRQRENRETTYVVKFQNMRPKGKSKTCQRRKLSVSHKGRVTVLRLSQEAKTTECHRDSFCPRGLPAWEAGQVQGRGTACRLGSAPGSPRLRYWPDPQPRTTVSKKPQLSQDFHIPSRAKCFITSCSQPPNTSPAKHKAPSHLPSQPGKGVLRGLWASPTRLSGCSRWFSPTEWVLTECLSY